MARTAVPYIGRRRRFDCVNPWPLTRRMWTELARDAHVRCVEVETFRCAGDTLTEGDIDYLRL